MKLGNPEDHAALRTTLREFTSELCGQNFAIIVQTSDGKIMLVCMDKSLESVIEERFGKRLNNAMTFDG